MGRGEALCAKLAPETCLFCSMLFPYCGMSLPFPTPSVYGEHYTPRVLKREALQADVTNAAPQKVPGTLGAIAESGEIPCIRAIGCSSAWHLSSNHPHMQKRFDAGSRPWYYLMIASDNARV